MEVVKFKDVYDNDIISYQIGGDEINLDMLSVPDEAMSFIYASDDIVKAYRIGLKITDISVLKVANLEQYKAFVKYAEENEGAEYSVCSIDGQLHFNCNPIGTVFVVDMKQLQACFYREIDLLKNRKVLVK